MILPSPLIRVREELWEKQNISLWIKRDDLIHPQISGNKFRKLQFLRDLQGKNMLKGILSFGGAFSNHLHALAFFCYSEGVPLNVFVRSYDENPDNPVLSDLRKWGVQVRILSPEEYRRKEDPEQIRRWEEEFPGHLILPEGGSHPDALTGIKDMMQEIGKEGIRADYYFVPVGTGATLAGMVHAQEDLQMTVGISALKTSELFYSVQKKWKLEEYRNWTIADQWHWGGYGKVPEDLKLFLKEFESRHEILLDPLYNGKAMYALCQYLRHELIPPGSVVVFIHTGGLQGWRGIESTMNKE